MRWFALLATAWSAALGAQPIVSPGPQKVEVTVYRAPDRGAGEPLDLRWLRGFALISEQRRVTIPAGESELRFEGVAGGIVSESAILTQLPAGVIEKNQDAALLSPASLLDASLGRRVQVRRTSLADGTVRETEAVIRSGAGGAVVLETPDGVEALRCSGLPETIIYPASPAGLVAKPTLSVRVRSERVAEATVTLSYLASGFDWQADYVAELSADGRRIDLFAWLTLANGDETGFVDADTQAVAGRLNREEQPGRRPQAAPLRLQCWPAGTTSSDLQELIPPPPPPPPAPVMMEEIVVTGSRMAAPMLRANAAITAVQEELGDLKLYRVPEPVTVAANSQKQVALLQREGVPVEIVYRSRIDRAGAVTVEPTLTASNRASQGLGIALPQGRFALFERVGDRRVLVGRGELRDLAIGEEVEVSMDQSSAVTADVVEEQRGQWLLTVRNAGNVPIRSEAGLDEQATSATRLARRDGRPLWTVTVPPGGEASLRYRIKPR